MRQKTNNNILFGLAELLNYISRFEQRAGESFNRSLKLSKQSKNIAESIFPIITRDLDLMDDFYQAFYDLLTNP